MIFTISWWCGHCHILNAKVSDIVTQQWWKTLVFEESHLLKCRTSTPWVECELIIKSNNLNVAETWSSMFPSHLRNAETWDFVLCLWLENFEQQVRPNYKPINFRKWASRTIIDIILSPCLPHFRALFSPPKHVCKVSRISIAWPSESGTLPHAVISKVSLTAWLSLLSFVYESLVKSSLLKMVSPFSMQFY